MNNFISILILILLLCVHKIHTVPLIVQKAKFLGNLKVSGEGYSVTANSSSQCLALCNKDPSCDAINYYNVQKKCRIFKRCVPLYYIASNPNYTFYAKRHPSKNTEFTYMEEIDSCLKITQSKEEYVFANEICNSDHGQMIRLYNQQMNKKAVELMRKIDTSYIWIHTPVIENANIDPDILDKFISSEQMNENRGNANVRLCTALQDNGLQVKLSCSAKLPTVCEHKPY